jgi:hypothetical protein
VLVALHQFHCIGDISTARRDHWIHLTANLQVAVLNVVESILNTNKSFNNGYIYIDIYIYNCGDESAILRSQELTYVEGSSWSLVSALLVVKQFHVLPMHWSLCGQMCPRVANDCVILREAKWKSMQQSTIPRRTGSVGGLLGTQPACTVRVGEVSFQISRPSSAALQIL